MKRLMLIGLALAISSPALATTKLDKNTLQAAKHCGYRGDFTKPPTPKQDRCITRRMQWYINRQERWSKAR